MPGLKRSPGMAEMDVDDQRGYEYDYNAPGDIHRQLPSSDLTSMKYRLSTIDPIGYPHFPPSLPMDWPESPSDDDDASSDVLVHEGFENRIRPPPQLKARMPGLEDSGLPPTPPTMENSDIADAPTQSINDLPELANGVRDILEPQVLPLAATPVNGVSPPTPDPSPPASTDALPETVQKEPNHFLHPVVAESRSLRFLRDNASSRAESFKTAQEIQPFSRSTSQVHLRAEDTLPKHWLDSSHELQQADQDWGYVHVEQTPIQDDVTPKLDFSTKRLRHTSKHESPPHTAEGHGTDWDRHISYVSGPDELHEHAMPEKKDAVNDTTPTANGLGLSGPGMQQAMERSVEDVNNMVYDRIRAENVKRHSTVSARSGAIAVSVLVPPSESTPRTLKRQTKCSSLRGDNGTESNRGSIDGDARPLTHKKVRLPNRLKKLGDSPVFEPSIRQVSSPARLGPDASKLTALTYASLQDSPSARQTAKFGPSRNHTLRHFTHGDRLSNNPSVRRTSLNGSPASTSRWLEDVQNAEPPMHSPPVTPPRTTSNADRAHNIGVKRSSTDGARPSRILEKTSLPIRGVIPSVDSEPPDSSPTSGRLRRFSRDERLENNGSVRRTSLSSSRDASTTRDIFGFRPISQDRNTFAPSEKSLGLSSPRKSLDARHLYPITTPGSVSQFSDRTDIEVCEASGVRIYPHNNNSLLVIQHGSRPSSKDKSLPDTGAIEESLQALGPPIFAAQVDPPTPILGTSDPTATAESPLTHPRTAPEPPVIQFIPPTPSSELDRELSPAQDGTLRAEVNLPQRRLTLLQRARRYSDSLFVRAGSLRRPQQRQSSLPDSRDNHLSPLWRPQGFWDEFDSEDEYYDDFEAAGSLPKGGDTSNVGEEEEPKRAGIFPRAMSKRLPGFRGQGGFLVGNSLGIDRHGSNSRRHYVTTRTRTVSKKQSEEMLNKLSGGASQDSLRKMTAKQGFTLPFSGGKKAQWVGTKRLRARMGRLRASRDEREREKRREELRGKIGQRIYHDTSPK